MALRVAIFRLHNTKVVSTGPAILRINNSITRMKHFNNESPLAKHTKKPMSTVRLVAGGISIGVIIGGVYAYFSKSERKLPGAIINTPTQIPKIENLPPNLKVTRKV